MMGSCQAAAHVIAPVPCQPPRLALLPSTRQLVPSLRLQAPDAAAVPDAATLDLTAPKSPQRAETAKLKGKTPATKEPPHGAATNTEEEPRGEGKKAPTTAAATAATPAVAAAQVRAALPPLLLWCCPPP